MSKIKLNHICKIEGHANLELEIEGNTIKKCHLEAAEGARFFEGIIIGKKYDEITEIVSRICGICSVGHTVTSLKTIETAFGINVTRQTEVLRELLTMGERIRSHATHLYFLCLPDYTGHSSAIEMASKYKKEITRALNLIKTGNKLVEIIGGREMHPFTSVVGGFTRSISGEEKNKLLTMLKQASLDAAKTYELFSKIVYPSFERYRENISLKQFDGFPLLEGTIISDKGVSLQPDKYQEFLKESFNIYSTSKFALREGKEFMVGALPRVNNNFKLLSGNCERLIKKSRIRFPSKNPFHNLIAQSLELVHWIEHAIDLLSRTEFFNEVPVEFKPKKCKGIAATEVPRGILYHHYEFDNKGFVTKSNIITPTVQNLKTMEKDIKEFVPSLLHKKKEEIILDIEKLIRAYDPCFSCSTHFLNVNWKRS
ncbi:hypothetical protein C0585_06545 [Candidatus Woesearchaeota archaeon]|nr:MAG: hypothetical protein C0585_06545 [Candidatus Woesearchaeota archaeon]